ncbi:hypothetical protein PROFUN_03962 [Planoprotostelium fungivorum]|uniref:Uncharacterized protein n=1 Tax=Planoprotostelium fungivorum TaxID=1890364 RepID=A0A2P6MTY5_9EUKA|nr:hypothetical protein PROFUN_03962 [Planoprotostelium fungivorum]
MIVISSPHQASVASDQLAHQIVSLRSCFSLHRSSYSPEWDSFISGRPCSDRASSDTPLDGVGVSKADSAENVPFIQQRQKEQQRDMQSPKSFYVLMAILVGVIIMMAYTSNDAEASVASGRHVLSSAAILPQSKSRPTFDKGTVSARLCAADDDGNCNLIGYLEAIGRMTIPALILVPISIVAWFACCLGRLCCNCFGGWERTPGNVCFGEKCCDTDCYENRQFQGYSTAGIWATKILLVLMFLGLVAVFVPGFLGNRQLGKGIAGPLDSVLKFGDDMRGKMNNIVGRLQVLPYTTNINGSLTSVYAALSDFDSYGDQAHTQLNQVERYRVPVYTVLLVITPVVVLLGILGGIFNCPKLICCTAGGLFWMSALIWLLFGIQYPMLIIVSDLCDELTIYDTNIIYANATANNRTATPSGKVTIFESHINITSCNSTTFDPVKTKIDDALNQAYSTACSNDILQSLCLEARNITQYMLLVGQCTDNVTLIRNITSQPVCQLIEQYINTNDISYCMQAVQQANATLNIVDVPVVERFGYPMVVRDECRIVPLNVCPTTCNYTTTRNATGQVIYQTDVLNTYNYIYETFVRPLLGCFLFAELVDDLKGGVCDNLTPGANMVEQTFLSIGILLIPTTILMMLAFKRWRSDSYEGAQSESGLEMSSVPVHTTIPEVFSIPYEPSYTTTDTMRQAPESPKEEIPPAYTNLDSPAPPAFDAEPDHEPESIQSETPPGYEESNPAYSPEPERLHHDE